MKRLFILLLSCLLFSLTQIKAQALQSPSIARGEIIVKFEVNTDLSAFFQKMNRNYPEVDFHIKNNTAPEWDIYVLGFENSAITEAEALAILQQETAVHQVQLNQKVQYREKVPDDSNWAQQWSMELINAPEAWEVTTGGVTPQGDTIVVAVLEKGYEPSHSDLDPNLWRNWGEIPGNFLDDDNNGATDDFLGYDVQKDTDGPGSGTSHGTSVMGIVGAKGDNTEGVTGVNWDVKIMPVLGVEYLDDIISAHKYVWRSRKLYNETNGAEGAFVVAVNASFGFDTVFPSSGPLYQEWCSLIDSLGHQGVLTVGATTNSNANVDLVGDMPTTCPSEYLISVTNVNQQDRKPMAAGYGSTHIDLGAPGSGAYTTVNNNSYGGFSGTSGATPHVTGSIALLYSLPCTAVSSNAISDPSGTALAIRDKILNNVAVNSTLADITTTGGRLDIGASMLAAEQTHCDGSRSEILTLSRIANESNPIGEDAVLRYEYEVPNYNFSYKVLVYAMDGRLMFEKTLNPEEFQTNTFEFDAFSWPSGKYQVMLFQGREFITDIFLKF